MLFLCLSYKVSGMFCLEQHVMSYFYYRYTVADRMRLLISVLTWYIFGIVLDGFPET